MSSHHPAPEQPEQLVPSSMLAAPSHVDPYPYYAACRKHSPFYYDAGLQLWVALSARVVDEVLTNPAFRVRPVGEPVPAPLLNSAAGAIFGSLVRMTDGPHQLEVKAAVRAALASVSAEEVTAAVDVASPLLWKQLAPKVTTGGLGQFCYLLPIYVVAGLLGFSAEALQDTCDQVSKLVRCIAPGGTPEQVSLGKEAAALLMAAVAKLGNRRTVRAGTLLARLLEQAGDGIALQAVLANSVGFLTQTYEATAGLIANTLLALARHAESTRSTEHTMERAIALVRETARYDSPVQNTRRFVAQETIIAGQKLDAGAVVLVVLAAANRDPDLVTRPDMFDASRHDIRSYTFSRGAHACPGSDIAYSIAAGALRFLWRSGFNPLTIQQPPRYRASLNGRVPELDCTQNTTRA